MTSPLATPPTRSAGPLLSPRSFSRRALGAAALAVVAGLGLAGCSTGPAGVQDAGTAPAATAGYPVTIKHAFGETTLEHQPRRVVTVSWVNDDVALALGVVPVGLPKNDWGGNSLYTGNPDGRAYKVSYNRPFNTRENSPEDFVFNA